MKPLVRPACFPHFPNSSTDAFLEALVDYAKTCVANGYILSISTTPIAPTVLATTSTTSTSSTSSITSTTSIVHYSSTTKTTGSSITVTPSLAAIIQPSQRAGLSAGAKAGISISVIAIIVALALGIIIFLKRQKRSQSAPDATLKFESSYPDAIQSDPAPIEKLITSGQSLQELHVDHKEIGRGINAAGNEEVTTSSLHQQGHLAQGASTQLPTALSELPAQQLPQSSVQRRKPVAELQAQTFQPPHVAGHSESPNRAPAGSPNSLS